MIPLPLLAIFKLACRNLFARKLRTLLTLSGIILGVAVVLAIDITNDSTLASIRTVFDEASGKASLVITDHSAVPEAFSTAVLKQAARQPGVTAAAPLISRTTLTVKQAAEWNLSVSVAGTSGANDLLVLGIQPDLDRAVREYSLVAGEWLPEKERRAYKALLVQDYADDQGYRVGDDVEILVNDGVKEKLRVVGLIAKQGPGLQNEGAVMVIPLDTAQRLFDLSGKIDQVDLVLEPAIAENAAALERVRQALQDQLGRNFSVMFPASRGDVTARQLQGYQVGLSFFSAMALFVGAFLIYNTFTMTVVERTREIGMLRALGMLRSQIGGLVLTEALLLGLAGSLAGVGFGLLLARGLMRSISFISGSEPREMSISTDGLAWSLLVGLGVTLVSALLPAIRASRVSPLEALRVSAAPPELAFGQRSWLVGAQLMVLAYAIIYLIPVPQAIQAPVGFASVFILLLGATLVVPVSVAPLEHTVRPFITGIYKGEGRLGSSNVRRARNRTALTVAALMIGIAMIIGIQTMTRSFETDIDHWVATALGGDLYVRSPQAMREELGTRLLAEPNVVAASPVTYYRTRRVPPDGKAENFDLILWVGLDPETYPQVSRFIFDDPTTDPNAVVARLKEGGALIISTTLADRYHVGPGDSLVFETRRGYQAFEVAAVAIDFSSQGYTVNGTRADVERFFGRKKVDTFILKLAPGTDVAAAAKSIEERHGKSRHLTVETSEHFRAKVRQVTAEAFSLFDVLGGIGVVIAALGVINTLLMNVFERQREIGGLRSLGMTMGQVARMILAESGTMGFIGGIFGIVFGLALSRIFLVGIQGIAGYTLTYRLPPESLLTSGVIALLVSQGAALYPAWKASRVRIVEAIQHE